MMSISVCMAVYNGEPYILRQINSILQQLDVNDELIISDDSSTDRTEEIISYIADTRIKFIKNTGRKGPIGNFENAIKYSSHAIIFLSDQDDVWLPDKVKKSLELLEDYDLILSDCKVVDASLNELYPSFFAKRNSEKGLLRNIYKNSYMGCCMAFRRRILAYALPFPDNIHMHDWWIGLIAEVKGKVFFYEEPLILYVRHGNNASPTGEESYSWAKKLYNRFYIIYSLINRLK